MGNFDIDKLVRSILADLSSEAISVPIQSETVQVENEIFIESRVVSLDDIRKIGDAKKIGIAPKSILTPSAKDEIRKRNIEIVTKLPRLAADPGSALWFATQRPATFPSNILVRFNTKTENFETVAEIVDAALKKLSNENRGVALTKQAASLLCEANRHKEIRAVFGFEPKQTASDAREVAANLLVLHPERIASTKMIEIVKNFFET